MTSYKKISFAFALAMLFQLTNCAQNNDANHTALDILKEKYEYKKDTKEIAVPANTPDQAPTITYSTKSHADDTGFTRTKITTEIKNGLIITTTEKWLTKHSSWFTWSKLVTGSIGMASIAQLLNHRLYDETNDNFDVVNEKNPILYNNEHTKKNAKSSYFYFIDMKNGEHKYDRLNNARTSNSNRYKAITAIIFSIPLAIAVFALYQYLSGQEKLNKAVVEKETIELERELMALQAKELEVLTQEPQL